MKNDTKRKTTTNDHKTQTNNSSPPHQPAEKKSGSIENVESYNRTHTGTRQEGVCERVKSCRVIHYSMFFILAKSAPDPDMCVTRSAVSDSTTLCVKDQTGLAGALTPSNYYYHSSSYCYLYYYFF